MSVHGYSTLCIIALVGLALGGPMAAALRADDPPKPIKVGMIGLDTSHVIAFTKTLNRDNAGTDLAGIHVVAAYPGGSPDVESSRTRVEGYTKEMREMGVEIVDSIEALLPKVDVVMLESVDGRPHLKQAEPVLRAGKPMFIDKPVAGTLADAIEIFRLAEEYKCPVFSSSSLRFSPGIIGMRNDDRVGDVLGCMVYSPCSLEPHHPDLFWYGVHGVEILYTIMGTGCREVSRVHTDDCDVATGVWNDGRVATFRGIRAGKTEYGATVFGTNGVVPSGKYAGYEPLLVEVAKFYRTLQPPVSAAETIEMFAIMEAADESKRQGGCPVTIESVMAKAKAGK
ncbi:MAG: Gfo/Idh/MocA family protein [Pirellulales bacterium]